MVDNMYINVFSLFFATLKCKIISLKEIKSEATSRKISDVKYVSVQIYCGYFHYIH